MIALSSSNVSIGKIYQLALVVLTKLTKNGISLLRLIGIKTRLI